MSPKLSSTLADVSIGLLSLLSCLALGYVSHYLLGGLPASLYGMIIFTLALQFKWISPTRVEGLIAWVIRHMAVCFIPAGVGIIEHQQLVAQHGIAIVTITFITTFLVLSFVGKCFTIPAKTE